MPSSFTPSLRLELQATGENRASWGQKANTVFSLVEEAICGKIDVNIANADMTLLAQNGATDQARPMLIKFTGTLTADRTVTFPEKSKIYILGNATVGGFSIIIKVSDSTDPLPGGRYTLAHNQQKLVYTDGITVWTNDNLITLSSPTARWSIPATIGDTGRMEVGNAIDFHNTNTDVADYAVRLGTAGSTSDLYLTASTPPGTLAAKIWHAGNDGAGSGMDADLLDGLHASEVFPEVAADGKVYGRKRLPAGVGGWVETPGPYVGFVTGDMSLGGAATGANGRIAFKTNATFTGTEVASISDIGEIKAATYFTSSTTAAVLAATGTGSILLRPLGRDATAQQTTIDASGNMIVNGNVTANGTINLNNQLNVNSIVQSTDTVMILASALNGTIYLRPNGAANPVEQVSINNNGTMVIDPSAAPGLIVNKPTSAQYTIKAFGASTVAAVLGYCNDTDFYGMLGRWVSGVGAWSFYGNGTGYTSGSWTTSDAKSKHDITECNCHDAYSKVRAIPVKAYRKYGAQRRLELASDEIGWLAQEIERIIPEAVLDVPIPDHDTAMREMVGGDTIKATNDRTMLATLWAAVQHQAEIIEKLQVEMQAMKGKA